MKRTLLWWSLGLCVLTTTLAIVAGVLLWRDYDRVVVTRLVLAACACQCAAWVTFIRAQ
jgi:hypothetical protein